MSTEHNNDRALRLVHYYQKHGVDFARLQMELLQEFDAVSRDTGRDGARQDGAGDIARERDRQVSTEGWTPQHDDEHVNGELALAAVCYAAPGPVRMKISRPAQCGCRSVGECSHGRVERWEDPWPWAKEWDKRGRHSRVRQLRIAGALIAAEIDRLKRIDAAMGEPAPAPDGSLYTCIGESLGLDMAEPAPASEPQREDSI